LSRVFSLRGAGFEIEQEPSAPGFHPIHALRSATVQ
jgi:hypothetical protein